LSPRITSHPPCRLRTSKLHPRLSCRHGSGRESEAGTGGDAEGKRKGEGRVDAQGKGGGEREGWECRESTGAENAKTQMLKNKKRRYGCRKSERRKHTNRHGDTHTRKDRHRQAPRYNIDTGRHLGADHLLLVGEQAVEDDSAARPGLHLV
jgi:hypothetical protein